MSSKPSKKRTSTSDRGGSGQQLKKFTYRQIQDKVAERWQIPEYYDILMEAAIKEDDDGIYINLKHPSFQKLVILVKDYESRKKKQETRNKKQKEKSAADKLGASSGDKLDGNSDDKKKDKSGEESPSMESSSQSQRRFSAMQTMNEEVNNMVESPRGDRDTNSDIILPPDSVLLQSNHSSGPSQPLKVKHKRQSDKVHKSQQEWLDILMDQLSSHSPSQKLVRQACKHVGIPIQLRATIWKILLDVPRRKAQLLKNFNEASAKAKQRKSPHFASIAEPDSEKPIDASAESNATSHNESSTHSGKSKSKRSRHKKTKSGASSPTLSSTASQSTSVTDDTSAAATVTDDTAAAATTDGTNETKKRHKSKHKKTDKSTPKSEPSSIAPLDTTTPGGNDDEFEPLRDDPPPLYNQRVIQADIERTRPQMECFQSTSVRREMEIILTEYCHRRKVSYKQGMNYILAPFFMIEMKDRLDIYLCFESFLEKFLNSTFNDEEFGSLQCIFRLFRLVFQYHDPTLSVFLDHHEIMPELFASGWFMTIHANKADRHTLLHLWDEILLEADPCFHYFVDLELLRFCRDEILKRSAEELPQFLVNIVVEDRDHARRLLKDARKTFVNTPLSFHELLFQCSKNQVSVDSNLYTRLERLPCLPLEPKELIGHCYADTLLSQAANHLYLDDYGSTGTKSSHSHKKQDDPEGVGQVGSEGSINSGSGGFRTRLRRKNRKKPSMPPPSVPSSKSKSTPTANPNIEGSSAAAAIAVATSEPHTSTAEKRRSNRRIRKLLKQSARYAEQKHLKFFIIDCRPIEQYEAGHLPCAFHLDPKLELSSEQLREKLMSLLSMKGCHFVLFFDGRDNTNAGLVNNNDPLNIQNAELEAAGTLNGPNRYQASVDKKQLLRQSYLYFFLEKRVKYISICEAGYAGCHELIVGDLELIDHDPDKCIECNGKWKNSLFSGMRGRFTNLIQAAGEKVRSRMIESRIAPTNANIFGRTKSIGIRLESRYDYTGFVLENSSGSKEMSPPLLDQIHLCRNEPLLMIYLSLLRDRELKSVEKFRDTTQKIITVMFQQLLNFHFIDKYEPTPTVIPTIDEYGNTIESVHNTSAMSGDSESRGSSIDRRSASASDLHSSLPPTNVDGTDSRKKNISHFGLSFANTSANSPFEGISFQTIAADHGVYGVALDDSSEHALQCVLSSFHPIIRSVVGTLKVEESFTQDKDGVIRSNRQAVALMPKDIRSRIVILFHPVIVTNELQSAIDALLRLGATEKDVIILCIVASHNALIAIVERFKRVQIWCVAIDGIENGRVTPGIGSFKHRYRYIKSVKQKKKNHTKIQPSPKTRTPQHPPPQPPPTPIVPSNNHKTQPPSQPQRQLQSQSQSQPHNTDISTPPITQPTADDNIENEAQPQPTTAVDSEPTIVTDESSDSIISHKTEPTIDVTSATVTSETETEVETSVTEAEAEAVADTTTEEVINGNEEEKDGMEARIEDQDE